MNRYVVVTELGDVYIAEGETVAEASEPFDRKYPGTVISVTLLPKEDEA